METEEQKLEDLKKQVAEHMVKFEEDYKDYFGNDSINPENFFKKSECGLLYIDYTTQKLFDFYCMGAGFSARGL